MSKLSYYKKIARRNRKRKSFLQRRRHRSEPSSNLSFEPVIDLIEETYEELEILSEPDFDLPEFPMDPGEKAKEKKKFNIFEKALFKIRTFINWIKKNIPFQ